MAEVIDMNPVLGEHGVIDGTGQPEAAEKPYTLRNLCSKDVFLFAKILSRVGVKQFGECFQVDEGEELSMDAVGLGVALNIIDILLNNLDKCEQEIYQFLAGVSGMGADQVMSLDMDVFVQMIIEIFHKREFSNFFKVVSRLLKSEN